MAVRLTKEGTQLSKPRDNQNPELKTLKPDHLLPKGFLRQSAVGEYLKCPYRFYLLYVENLRSPPSVALVEGSAHHAWLEKENIERINKDRMRLLKNSDAIDVFEHYFKKEAKDIGTWEEDSPDTVMNRAMRIITNYHKYFASSVKPKKAEMQIEMMIGDVPFLGSIDLLEDGDVISDYKIGGKHKSPRDLEHSLQLPLYASAVNSSKVRLISVNKNSRDAKDSVKSVAGTVTRSSKAWAQSIVLDVADSVKKGAFPKCAPDSWWCSNRFCGFWNQCRGAKVPPKTALKSEVPF